MAATAATPPPSEPAQASDLWLSDFGNCALLREGGLACWGDKHALPQIVPNSADVVEVGLGMDALMLHRDGSLSALRYGGEVRRLAKLRDVEHVAAAGYLACGLLRDKTVHCYRNMVFATSEPGAAEQTPQALVGVRDASSLGVGPYFACVVRTGGKIGCAHVGPNSAKATYVAPIPGITGATRVVVGVSMACAELSAGGARCFSLGQTKRWIHDIPDATTVGVFQGDDFADSALVCSAAGQTVSCQRPEQTGGSYSLPALTNVQLQVPDGDEVVRIGVLNHAVCALTKAGDIHCQGHNIRGALGQANPRLLERAMAVPGLGKARGIAVGDRFGCALTQSREVWCWGQFPTIRGSTGEQPADSRPKRVPGLARIERIVATESYACAYDEGGRAHCFFGPEQENKPRAAYPVPALDHVAPAVLPDLGVLGQGIAIDAQGGVLLGPNPGFDDLKGLTLSPVAGLSDIAEISGAYSRFLVRSKQGRVWMMRARQGKLEAAPEPVPDLTGVTDIEGSRLMLLAKGKVVRIDDDVSKPVTVVESSDLMRLVAGPGVCGLTRQRAARCIPLGQEPGAVLFERVKAIEATAETQCAIDDDDRVLCRGACSRGECGVTHGVYFTATPMRVPLTKPRRASSP